MREKKSKYFEGREMLSSATGKRKRSTYVIKWRQNVVTARDLQHTFMFPSLESRNLLITLGRKCFSNIGPPRTRILIWENHLCIGIATGYGLDGRGIESQWGQVLPRPSRPSLGPTQPPMQWVPVLSSG